jgi:hypothetical protein
VRVDHDARSGRAQLAHEPEQQAQRREEPPVAQQLHELRARPHPEAVDLGMAGEQRGGLVLDQPADLRRGLRAAQGIEHRQHVDHVAERREPDDQNAARSRVFAHRGR